MSPTDQPLTIDCDECVMQPTSACDDCVVTFLCSREPDDAVIVDVVRGARPPPAGRHRSHPAPAPSAPHRLIARGRVTMTSC